MATKTVDLGRVSGFSAYEQAKAGGYSGTEAAFNALLASVAGFPTRTEVDAALALKAYASCVIKPMGDTLSKTHISQVARILDGDARFPSGYGAYVCMRPQPDGVFGCYDLHLYCSQGHLYYQMTSDGNEITQAGWQRTVIATPPPPPPQELPLPLTAGLRASGDIQSSYKRNHEFEVTISCIFEKSGTVDDIPNAMCVCTLPYGYRPAQRIVRMARVVSGASTCEDQTLYADSVIYPDGSVIVNMAQAHYQYKVGILECSFPAAPT